LPEWASDYDDLIGLLRKAGVAGFFTDFPGLAR
jgi:glycerophosphoryl diester phosphodiesterase